MFKKKYLAVAGMIVLALMAAGCGKKKNTETEVQVTPTPVENVTVTPTQELVNMESVTEKNIMGEKTSTASKLTLVNRTGADVAAIYIRETPSEDDDEWGDDLVNGTFTLKNGETAVYYYEGAKTSAASYDIRITYTDEERSECFFRKLPLKTMQQITLRMDGEGEDAIPYATYMTSTGKKETSTLKEVKKRLGLDDSDDENSDSSDSSSYDSDSSSADNSSTAAPTSTPSQDQSTEPEPDGTDSTIQTAESYIGMSVEELEGAVGDSQYAEYDDDDATGMTGYYYYPNFTVSTTVDEDGNEIVTGVW